MRPVTASEKRQLRLAALRRPFTDSDVSNAMLAIDRLARDLADAQAAGLDDLSTELLRQHTHAVAQLAEFEAAAAPLLTAEESYRAAVADLEAAELADEQGTEDERESDEIIRRLHRAKHRLSARRRALEQAQAAARGHLRALLPKVDRDQERARTNTEAIADYLHRGANGVPPFDGAAPPAEVRWHPLFEHRALRDCDPDDREMLAELFRQRRAARERTLEAKRRELARLTG